MRARRIAAVAALALAGGMATPPAVEAQTICQWRDALIEKLRAKHGETPVAAGVTSAGNLIEILAAPDGTTWTAIITSPAGMSCPTASGTDWQDRPAPEPEGHGTHG